MTCAVRSQNSVRQSIKCLSNGYVTMNLSELIIPTFRQMLLALSRWLKKAQSVNEASDAFLSSRLASNMYPLSTQIRFSCVQVYEALARLNSAEIPPIVEQLLEEGRKAPSHHGTLEDAQTRIEDTIAYLESQQKSIAAVDESLTVELSLPNDITFAMNAEQFVRDWAIPQFYFHIMTAYSILRSEGVPIGKADYVQHMFAYVRE